MLPWFPQRIEHHNWTKEKTCQPEVLARRTPCVFRRNIPIFLEQKSTRLNNAYLLTQPGAFGSGFTADSPDSAALATWIAATALTSHRRIWQASSSPALHLANLILYRASQRTAAIEDRQSGEIEVSSAIGTSHRGRCLRHRSSRQTLHALLAFFVHSFFSRWGKTPADKEGKKQQAPNPPSTRAALSPVSFRLDETKSGSWSRINLQVVQAVQLCPLRNLRLRPTRYSYRVFVAVPPFVSACPTPSGGLRAFPAFAMCTLSAPPTTDLVLPTAEIMILYDSMSHIAAST